MRTRLALALLIAVAPIAALLVITHVEGLKEQRQAQVENFQTIGDTLGATLDGFARDMESVSLTASIALSDRPLTQESTGNYLRNLRDSYGILRAVFITDLDGRVIATDSGAMQGLDLASQSYVAALRDGDDNIWRSFEAEGDDQPTIVHGQVIRGLDQTPAGYLFISFFPSQLTTRLPTDLPPESNVSLLDAAGNVLFMTKDTGRTTGIGESAAFVEASQNGVARIGRSESPVDKGERYGSFVRVPRTGWVLGFTMPASAVDGPYQDRILRDLAIVSSLVLGGLVFMMLVASRLSKPLSSLAGAADALARGEQPLVPIDAADADVRKLERAMDAMTQAINEREDRLLAQTRVLETLERVGETLATELDFEDAVSSITIAAMQLTQAQSAGIYYREDGDIGKAPAELKLLGVAGNRTFPLGSDDPLVRRTLAGEVLDVPEIGVFPAARQPPQLDGGGIVHSFLGIPIKTRFGDVHGGLFLLHDKQAAFGQRHVMLAAGLARRASIVVENAKLYSQAREQQEELRQASMAKSEFIGLMSHELRTPITTIFGGARLLRTRRSALDQQSVEEMIGSIEEESERLYRLVENLLTLARTDLYENIDVDVMSIAPVVDHAVSQFRSGHPNREVTIAAAKGLPLVMGESVYLHQVLNNLISNADKYSPPGQPIQVEILHRAPDVVVKVMDRGPGVTAEEIDMIFESFYRSKTTADQAGGKGMGLTVVKRLIEAMSGEVWAKNRRGGGLEVSFSLPAASVEADEEDDVSASPAVFGS
ncbi:MAG TPA: ATP-binding protein [Dehalococcoidia bacterium]|nr:ATP-binding protein [Dehalococcoidia bacterium]